MSEERENLVRDAAYVIWKKYQRIKGMARPKSYSESYARALLQAGLLSSPLSSRDRADLALGRLVRGMPFDVIIRRDGGHGQFYTTNESGDKGMHHNFDPLVSLRWLLSKYPKEVLNRYKKSYRDSLHHEASQRSKAGRGRSK